MLLAGLLITPIVIAVGVYRAPLKPSRSLLYLRSPAAEAVVVLRADPRRGQLPGDQRADTLSAWPRGAGAGGQLRDWVVQDVHAKGGRITGTAVPWAVRKYYRGSYVDGWTWPFLVRIASAPRPTQHPAP